MQLDGPLVSTDWLAAHLTAPRLRVFDTTVVLQPRSAGFGYLPMSGRAAWAAGHIPGAGFLDVIEELSDRNSTLPFMMPPAEQFAAAMAAQGVGDDAVVVLYNKGLPMWATRVWWMLRSIGFEQVAVLNGGVDKWLQEGRPQSTAAPAHARGQLSVRAQMDMWVDKAAMLRLIEDGQPVAVNALAPAVYSGEKNQYGRPGHLPGTFNVYYGDLIDPVTGEFHPPQALRPLFEPSAALAAERVVAYCGGGISATMDALALHLCGQRNVAVYDGSMSEWVKDPSLPLTLGDAP